MPKKGSKRRTRRQRGTMENETIPYNQNVQQQPGLQGAASQVGVSTGMGIAQTKKRTRTRTRTANGTAGRTRGPRTGKSSYAGVSTHGQLTPAQAGTLATHAIQFGQPLWRGDLNATNNRRLITSLFEQIISGVDLGSTTTHT